MLNMPLPKRERKNPTFSRMKSTLTSVANKTTPKNLYKCFRYVMKRGEKIMKNLPAKRWLIAR